MCPCQVLSEAECGSSADKLRLFLIHYLCSGGPGTAAPTDADEAAMLQALEEAGADTKPLAYMKQWKSIMKVSRGWRASQHNVTTTQLYYQP